MLDGLLAGWRRLLLRMFNGQPPGHRLVPTDYAPAMRALYGKGAVPPPAPSAAFLAARASAVPRLAAPDLPPGRVRPKAWCLGCSAQARLSRAGPGGSSWCGRRHAPQPPTSPPWTAQVPSTDEPPCRRESRPEYGEWA